MGFVIHWHESAMYLHVFPTRIPPPTSLSTRSLWVFPVHQAQARVSCIQPGLVICFTLDNIHVSMLSSRNIPPSPSPPESKRKSSKLFPSNSKKADIFICAQICEQILGIAHLCAVGWVDQSSPTLYSPMDLRPPGSSVHGTLQARILEWVAMPSSRASSRPRDQAHIYMCAQICEQTLGISHLYNFKSFLFCQQKKESQSYYTVVLKSQPCLLFRSRCTSRSWARAFLGSRGLGLEKEAKDAVLITL